MYFLTFNKTQGHLHHYLYCLHHNHYNQIIDTNLYNNPDIYHTI